MVGRLGARLRLRFPLSSAPRPRHTFPCGEASPRRLLAPSVEALHGDPAAAPPRQGALRRIHCRGRRPTGCPGSQRSGVPPTALQANPQRRILSSRLVLCSECQKPCVEIGSPSYSIARTRRGPGAGDEHRTRRDRPEARHHRSSRDLLVLSARLIGEAPVHLRLAAEPLHARCQRRAAERSRPSARRLVA